MGYLGQFVMVSSSGRYRQKSPAVLRDHREQRAIPRSVSGDFRSPPELRAKRANAQKGTLFVLLVRLVKQLFISLSDSKSAYLPAAGAVPG
jgi:hypothetical protein